MKIGFITIGQAPRDDIVPEIMEVLGAGFEIIEKGVLDGLSNEQIKELGPNTSDKTLVTRLRNGNEVKIAERYIISGLKNCIIELEELNVEIIVLLCTGEFPEIESNKILLRPNLIIENIIKGTLKKGKLGVIVPSSDQMSLVEKKWGSTKLPVVYESLSPYTGTDKDIIETANKIKNKNVDLLVLDCIGYSKKIKTIFRDITKKPVLLPSTITGMVIKELVTK